MFTAYSYYLEEEAGIYKIWFFNYSYKVYCILLSG